MIKETEISRIRKRKKYNKNEKNEHRDLVSMILQVFIPTFATIICKTLKR